MESASGFRFTCIRRFWPTGLRCQTLYGQEAELVPLLAAAHCHGAGTSVSGRALGLISLVEDTSPLCVNQAMAPAMAAMAASTHFRQPVRLWAIVALRLAISLLMLCVNRCFIV